MSSSGGGSSRSISLSDRLRRFDVHSSVEKEFRVYTTSGAVVSVLTVALILYLTISEFIFHFQVTTQERVHVNATSSTGIELEFDVSFLDVPCDYLSIDANDPTGQSQSMHLDRTHHVWKHRIIFRNGKETLLGKKERLELGSTLRSQADILEEAGIDVLDERKKDPAEEQLESPDYCGSCYGAGEEGECCNSCDDVERAYKRKGWLLQEFKDIPQCAKRLKQSLQKDEGCNVHGRVALSSGGGNLHLAPSKSALQDQAQQTSDKLLDQHQLVRALMEQLQQWNVSHVIHKLRFGPDYPSAVNQLDNATRSIGDNYGMYQYYFQVVPTRYKFLNGTVIQTNQYSVTEHLRHVDFGAVRGLPGVFFFYEVSPLHVEIEETYRQGWVAFFTSVCAVVGGVVTVMGMVDQYLFRSRRGEGGLAK